MIGTTVSHYKIVERLGEGGMGVVYRAEDTRLKRQVALKFLPPEMTRDNEAKERFVQEAQAASALDHPAICNIHEIDQTEDGQLFICMAIYEGEPVDEKLAAGPVDVEETVRIGIQVAEGLHKAHENGVIHRDIKPANLFYTKDRQTKILDFGLAKLNVNTHLTMAGTTLGTAAYMSPEQARGEEVDGRTDLWSLGVVLYEMLAGRRPFRSDYEQALVYSILNEDPESIEEIRPEVPVGLAGIVVRLLSKEPEGRFENAREVAEALRNFHDPALSGKFPVSGRASRPGRPMIRRGFWIAGAAALLLAAAGLAIRFTGGVRFGGEGEPEKPMLVVLPLDNRGPPEDEYFADGITDAITARLAGIHGIGVISRQSAMQYKGSDKTIDQIGEELGVDYILEGSVQRERPSDPSSKLRILPSLIRVENDISVWAQTFDEDMTELFRVQSEIAERVARALDITLLEPERREVESKPTENLEAYEFFLQANDFFRRKMTEQDTQLAIERYEQAVRLDPGFAEAWASLARARVWLKWNYGHEEEIARAQIAVDEALRLAPDLSETHMALGDFHYYGSRNFERALEHFTTVQMRRPSAAEATAAIGWILRRQGKWDEGVEHLLRAHELNPRDPTLNHGLGQALTRMGRYKEGEQYLDRAISLVPDMVFPYVDKVLLYIAWDGDTERACAVFQEAVQRIPPPEFLGATPFSLVRIMPDPCAGLFSRIEIDAPGMDTATDTAFCYLYKAEAAIKRGEGDEAAAWADSARILLETMVSLRPGKGYLHSYLGLAYASLGMREEAIREGEKAVELLPLSRDALSGTYQIERLAESKARVGEYGDVVDDLGILLSVPSRISVSLLQLDPLWDPLRGGRRFEMLLEQSNDLP